MMLLAVYGSCISIVLPQSFLISYMAFGTTHLILRGFNTWRRQKADRERLVNIFKS